MAPDLISMSSKEETSPPKILSTNEVDMSERAIAGRLEMVRALYKLGRSLMSIDMSQAKLVEPKQR